MAYGQSPRGVAFLDGKATRTVVFLNTPTVKMLCARRRSDDDYCNSLVTACCVLLACAKALMPVWVRIWYFDSSDVAVV
jgi:hypothetical protein